MKNHDTWQPSKYIYRKGKLVASRNSEEVGVGSRLITDLIAELYDENIQQHAKGRLLDLGCGKAPLFHTYKDYVSDNVCVDWQNTLHKNKYLDYECDLTQALPFQDEEFDTIILSDVLEHLPQPQYLWNEMFRILAVKGKIIMNVPFYYWLHEQPNDYYRYTEFALQRFVQISGMKLIKLKSIGGTPEIMTDIFAKNIQHMPMIGRSLALFSQWLTLSIIKTRFGKKISEETKANFPFGYFLIAEKPE